MPKALVTGGATGLLGQALVRELAAQGWDTATLGREDGDLFDQDFLEERIRQADADVIFNTVAYTQVDDAEDHESEAMRINYAFPQTLARIVDRLPKGHLAHYSTDFVFSGAHPGPWKETDSPCPDSVYGTSKLEGEKAVSAILPDRSCILRVAWLYGPGRKNFVDTIIKASQKNHALKVVHDQTGSPTCTLDAASWSAALAKKRPTGIWHLVNSGHATWCELAAEALGLYAAQCKVVPIRSDEWPQKARRPVYSVLDNSKLANALGQRPRSWSKALREYIFSEYALEHSQDQK